MKRTFVFDTGPLSHFARAGHLETLRAICEGFRCVMTDAVHEELERGSNRYPSLRDALDADWIELVHLHELDVLGRFAEYARVLGSSHGRAARG